MSIEISKESRQVKDWKENFTPAERATIYTVLFTVMLSPNYVDYRGLSPLLRYGAHSDPEAKAYIRQHPEQFNGFELDYYKMLEVATEFNYAMMGVEPRNATIEQRDAASQFPEEGTFVTADDMLNNDLPQPTSPDAANGKIPDTNIPVDLIANDMRSYMPFEEQLGMNVWPLVGALAAIFVAPTVTGGYGLKWLVTSALGRVAAGMSVLGTKITPASWQRAQELGLTTPAQRAWQIAKGAAYLNLGVSAASLGVMTTRALLSPVDVGIEMEEAEFIAKAQLGVDSPEEMTLDAVPSNYDREALKGLAERLNVVIGGKPTPDGVDPEEQIESYGREAQTVIDNSAIYPDAKIVADREAPRLATGETAFNSLTTPTTTPGTTTTTTTTQPGTTTTQPGTTTTTQPGVTSTTNVDSTGITAQANSIFDNYNVTGTATSPVTPGGAGPTIDEAAASYEAEAVAAMQDDPRYQWVLAESGQEAANYWAIMNYDPNAKSRTPTEPSPYIGAGRVGSPIQPATRNPDTGEWTNSTYRVMRQGPTPAYVPDEMKVPRVPRYDADYFSKTVANMTPGQLQTFVEQGIQAGIIDEKYVTSGMMDSVIAGAMQEVMYQANISGYTWQDVLDRMVKAYQEEKEKRRGQSLTEWYNNFVPSTAYQRMDPDTIAQKVKVTMRNEIGRDPNQWEIDLFADGMRSRHREAYDAQVASERSVWNATGRAREYDEPQDKTVGAVQGVDENASFQEEFEKRYDTEIGQMERHDRMEQDSRNLFGSLSQLSRLGGGV